MCLFVVCANVYVLYCRDARQRLTLANVDVCVRLVRSLLLTVNVELCNAHCRFVTIALQTLCVSGSIKIYQRNVNELSVGIWENI